MFVFVLCHCRNKMFLCVLFLFYEYLYICVVVYCVPGISSSLFLILLQKRKVSCSWRPQRWIRPTLKLLSMKSSQVAPSESQISSPPGELCDLPTDSHNLQPSKWRWPADRWPVAPSAPWPCPAPSEPLTPRRRRGAAARAPNTIAVFRFVLGTSWRAAGQITGTKTHTHTQNKSTIWLSIWISVWIILSIECLCSLYWTFWCPGV